MSDQQQLKEEIARLKAQIEEYKLKCQDEAELKRQCEEALCAKTSSTSTSPTGTSGTVLTTAAAEPAAAGLSRAQANRSDSAGALHSSTSAVPRATPSSDKTTSIGSSASASSLPARKKDGSKKDKKDGSKKNKKDESKKDSTTSTALASSSSSSSKEADKPSSADNTTGPAAPTTFAVRAIEAYKGSSKTALSFSKGAIITVLEQNDAEGTFRGQMGKKEGWYRAPLLLAGLGGVSFSHCGWCGVCLMTWASRFPSFYVVRT